MPIINSRFHQTESDDGYRFRYKWLALFCAGHCGVWLPDPALAVIEHGNRQSVANFRTPYHAWKAYQPVMVNCLWGAPVRNARVHQIERCGIDAALRDKAFRMFVSSRSFRLSLIGNASQRRLTKLKHSLPSRPAIRFVSTPDCSQQED